MSRDSASAAPRRRRGPGPQPLDAGVPRPPVHHTPPCPTCNYPLLKTDTYCPRCRMEGRA